MATSPLSRTLPITARWTALYTDGERFEQPLDDRPTTPRPDGTGSAFTDVDLARVHVFFLESTEHLYQVHLDDGHFEIDGVSFKVGDDDGVDLGPRRLLFYRRVAHDQHTDIRDGERVGESRLGDSRRCYILGWIAHVKDGRGRLTADTRIRTIEVGHEVFRP
jgi:hypothetical protein